MLDFGGRGLVTVNDFKTLLGSRGANVTDRELHMLFSKFDQGLSHGQITKHQFLTELIPRTQKQIGKN